MPAKSTTGEQSRKSEMDAQQTLLREEEAENTAANAISNTTAASARYDTFPDQIDLVTSDPTMDDEKPPAYGEIHAEKDGLGTSASVTDDGRVNIHINQLNRRLSQIFTTPLDQHIRDAEESHRIAAEVESSYQAGTKNAPRLNIVIQVVGSRGDVQPFVALGKVLRETYGHRVRLATHPMFKQFVEEHGLEFFSIGGDPSRLMAYMVKNPGLRPGFRSIASGDIGQRRQDVAEYIQGCWRSCYQAGDGIDDASKHPEDTNSNGSTSPKPFVADCIIANPPSFAHIHCAQKLGIPLHIMFTMPYSPTQAFSHPLANIQSSNADSHLTNYISYALIEILSWQALGDIINRFRTKCLGLDPVSRFWGPGTLQRLKVPHTYCWSPALIPKPKDWGAHISIAGFYFLNTPDYTPDGKLRDFLSRGPPPVYIGFGSIVLSDPDAMTELVLEAAKASGQRILLSKGWGGMGAGELRIPDNIFMLGNVPHDWLFKHVSCVVHHGGAGTTAAGIAAGRPTVIVPFFGDQPFWGEMIARAGAGPDPIPHKQLTGQKLADAIAFCLESETVQRAKDLASEIAEERGSEQGAQSFHQSLRPDRLRCALSPSRASVWHVKGTKVDLSAFAACTLANANLLDFKDLKLFRAEEHYVDEGPRDPISGGFTAAVGAFSGMAMGLADIPSETWRATRMPTSRSRQQSLASSSTEPSTHTTSLGRSPSVTSLTSKASSTKRKPFSRSTTLPTPSHTTSPQENVIPALRNAKSPNPPKQADIMQPTGIHMSRGAGRLFKEIIQGPVDISNNLTRGLHNMPKLWGDSSVRPQERVTDFRSGMKAVGREFGFGFYDGLGGLVTQPWKGAREEGVGGFFKGVGKGVGGFGSKLGAACTGILSHTMQGVSKEVQKLFTSDVQNYILASRAAQGYEEWLESSEAEREDIIAQWKIMRKAIKGKGKRDDAVQRPEAARDSVRLGDERIRTADTFREGSVDSARTNIRSSEHILAPGGAFASQGGSAVNRKALQTQPQRTPEGKTAIAFTTPLAHQQPDSFDHGHLAGTTLSEFEASRAAEQSEKTPQEQAEEAIVLDYIKKQSLLEAQHRSKSRAEVAGLESEEERNIQKALELSLLDARGLR
jgi:UDP:flavonoid glycosyltransferase YjiC (YdhE family)